MSFQLINSIPVWGNPEPNVIEQVENCRKDAVGIALMADHHLGYSVPIGGVIAYEDKISPSGVGFDIACGNKAVLLDISKDQVMNRIKVIMDDVWRHISFGVGRKNNEQVDHPLFDDPAWETSEIKSLDLKQMASRQLGTIGSGNHYVDIFIDEKSRVWCGVHFGSRGLGHKLATHFLALAGGKDGIMAPPVTLDVDSDLGQQYLSAMELAGQYAYAGRDWVCNKVAQILGAKILDEVHNHHNFAWKEHHQGTDLWVVRKGATPAFPGQRGFIGGSMTDISVIVEGIPSEDSAYSFCSTVHGAGRVMSRRQAKKQISNEQMMQSVAKAKIELRGAGLDEAPQCYKRLPQVLNVHKESIKILHTLTPVGVAMAGAGEIDPYKD